MYIRPELENTLITFAATKGIAITFEGRAFKKPNGQWLQCFLLNEQSNNATVDAYRQRNYGIFQINVYSPDGVGNQAVELLAEEVAALYPVAPKSLFQTISIEQPAQKSQAMIDGSFRFIALTIRYRYESSY